ncbi:Mlo-related protein [Dillenia turbinata]|uniref:Mlo-related protein n=1 Tax=Dillenia turbinata TaxID=194707 RepID=A0AAN8V9A5_9MAGN
MAGGYGPSLEKTPTWAVAIVCLVLLAVSILLEKIIHFVGHWLKKKRKNALYEALEKIKSELMLMGFISLLLTILQDPISEICVSESVGASWHPCNDSGKESDSSDSDKGRRRLLWFLNPRRSLAADQYTDTCTKQA